MATTVHSRSLATTLVVFLDNSIFLFWPDPALLGGLRQRIFFNYSWSSFVVTVLVNRFSPFHERPLSNLHN